jgi:hypothetical protein
VYEIILKVVFQIDQQGTDTILTGSINGTSPMHEKHRQIKQSV